MQPETLRRFSRKTSVEKGSSYVNLVLQYYPNEQDSTCNCKQSYFWPICFPTHTWNFGLAGGTCLTFNFKAAR